MARGIPAWARVLGESLLQAVGQSDPVQAVRDGTPRRIADQIGQWAAHLGSNAAVQWAPSMLRKEYCSHCDVEAVARCMACGDPTCLGHSHVSYTAEIVCDDCVNKLINGGGRHPQTKEEQAFEYFHLTPKANLEEVRAAYKLRAKAAHPDVGGKTKDMQEVNAQLQVLEKYFERRAA